MKFTKYFKSSFFKRWLRLTFILVTVLWIGPYVYVQLGIPRIMRPVNYYDFINTGFLLYLVYRFELFEIRRQQVEEKSEALRRLFD